MSREQLENPAWYALTGPHQHLAVREGNAVRYPADISPITAVKYVAEDTLRDLAMLHQPGDTAAVGSLDGLESPYWVFEREGRGVRMLCTDPMPVDTSQTAIIELGAADAPAMQALVALTEPGPFEARTYLLGRYFGVRVAGQLIAMAGQRLALDDYVEISAVCTHPDHRRQGLASILSSKVMQVIMQAGKTPFLHAFADNAPAIAAYEKLGFELIKETTFTVLRRVDV